MFDMLVCNVIKILKLSPKYFLPIFVNEIEYIPDMLLF